MPPLPVPLYTFDSLTEKEKVFLKKDGEFAETFDFAFKDAFKKLLRITFLYHSIKKDLMAEYLKMEKDDFLFRYKVMGKVFMKEVDMMCVDDLEEQKLKIESEEVHEIKSEEVQEEKKLEIESEEVEYCWASLTPLQKKMAEDGKEFSNLFGQAFYDIFRDAYNVGADEFDGLMAEYMTVGHEAFLTRYKKSIKGFMQYVDYDAVAKLKQKFPKEMLDGRGYLEKKKNDLKEQLAEVNKALTA
jgi:hypothetical protein